MGPESNDAVLIHRGEDTKRHKQKPREHGAGYWGYVVIRQRMTPFPRCLGGKEPPCQYRSNGSIPWSGRSPREGNGNPHQYSCLGNPMDRGAWWATGHGVAKSQAQL